MPTRRSFLAGASTIALVARTASAQTDDTIRLGLLQDAYGTNSSIGGVNSIHCAQMAADELAGSLGFKVEFVHADHQNKPDVGLLIARQWIDQGVDAMLEFNNSAVALAVSSLIRDRDKVMLANNVGTSRLTGRDCTPNETHWGNDTAMLSRCVANALYEQGGKTWFFIRRDDVFGQSLREETGAIVEARGGKVVGEVKVSLGTPDFSSELLSAQSSRANVVALALAGTDLLNCLKQAREFGLMSADQTIATLVLYEQDIRSLGLAAAQGTLLTNSFYWDLDDRTRAFSRRVMARTGGEPPNMAQAGAYAAVKHYLQAVAVLGAAQARQSGRRTVARMKEMGVDGEVFANASIRKDGRVISDAYVFRVKSPRESAGGWDLLHLQETIGPQQAWRPLAEGGCPLVSG